MSMNYEELRDLDIEIHEFINKRKILDIPYIGFWWADTYNTPEQELVYVPFYSSDIKVFYNLELSILNNTQNAYTYSTLIKDMCNSNELILDILKLKIWEKALIIRDVLKFNN